VSSSDKLKKAYILPCDQNGNETSTPIQVLFNPEQYSVEKSDQFASMAIPGRDVPIIQFVRGEAETLSMDIFFDTYTYYQSKDVTYYTKQVSDLLIVNKDIHAPPVVKFHWGSFSFTGVLEKVSKKFTMFTEGGTPVRATLSVTFRQFTAAPRPTSSPDYTKMRTVIDGDSLWLIASQEYGDTSQWRVIANFNASTISNPRILVPGTQLIIPPL
jgi:nucleoid-associated protein YgaU